MLSDDNKPIDKHLNGFTISPYVRFSYYENEIVRLFVDGTLGFSTQKYDYDGAKASNGFEIGAIPGIAIKLNNHFSLNAKCGFLGYKDNYRSESAYGLALSSLSLQFGFLYEF